jgi:hypothetical protein
MHRHKRGVKPKFDRLFSIRYRNPNDQTSAIIKIVKPTGGTLAYIEEHSMLQEADTNPRFKHLIFNLLHQIDDIIVSAEQFDDLQRQAVQGIQFSILDQASMATERLLT